MDIKTQFIDFINSAAPLSDATNIVHKLVTPTYTTNNLVADLKDVLSSEDDRLRFRATTVLSSSLRTKPLSPESKQVFIDYLSSRLIDVDCLTPILEALLFLVDTPLSQDIEQEILECFSALKTQLLPKETRVLLYTLFRNLASTSHNPDMVQAAVALVELERDPECLLLTFDIIKTVSANNEIDAETAPLLFDCSSAYFPILYPPRGDEELRLKLTDLILEGFTSNEIFAQLAVPFLLDKLDADLSSIKLEALRAILYCLHHYKEDVVCGYYEQIWDVIELNISTAGVVEINDTAFEITALVCNAEKKISGPILELIKKFIFRMMGEKDEIIIAFVNGLISELTRSCEAFYEMFAKSYLKCFHDQLEESLAGPKEQFERELKVVRLLYQRAVEGKPLYDEMKGQKVWDLHIIATPSHPCFISLLDLDVSFGMLNLIGEHKLETYKLVVETAIERPEDIIEILQRLFEREERTMMELMSVDCVIQSLELVTGIGAHSPLLFGEILKQIPQLKSSQYVPVLQSLLSDAIPENCLDKYVESIVPVFEVITQGEVSPLFPVLMNRVSRLHLVLGEKRLTHLQNAIFSALEHSPRLILVLPSVLQKGIPNTLYIYLNNVKCVDKDTRAIYALLSSYNSESIPEALKDEEEYFEGYKSVFELEQDKEPVVVLKFVDRLCRNEKKAVECLKEVSVFWTLDKASDEKWKKKLFDLTYNKYTAAHKIENVEEAHTLILLFSLLPTEDLMVYEETFLKIFKIICVKESSVDAIDTVVVLLYNILPTVSKYPMSLVESQLEDIIDRIFNVLYIKESTIKFRCDLIDLLTRIRINYGSDVVEPYKKNVLKKLYSPLDDNKRNVRQSAANCRNIWGV
ncbi:DNA repair/transcription protein met18/mms19, putative [Entamoeba invadens IP1]|uniref:MMS19 nucleotide excision repair protein n=1 Tax=Entamoeba invadens IP1 TaxID=370355 RepID=A0A0A1UCC6_ENTIV|nr:DNA repair/transcription protein met18/mms19, putative [Entamoeba invadens IP1]ELP92798.1 DNA repair/transcription protein met18/mms19, putative [Entamoeba invadens IP1]|eukprot:XP_004259569.1 DNA repair/transcription protein met18/mms19, putative [Entamoeba invadens IP1]